jgi:hypothetical protein
MASQPGKVGKVLSAEFRVLSKTVRLSPRLIFKELDSRLARGSADCQVLSRNPYSALKN